MSIVVDLSAAQLIRRELANCDEGRSANFFGSGDTAISVEFLPPYGEADQHLIRDGIKRLAPLHPKSASVTFGTSAAVRAATHQLVTDLARSTNTSITSNLTAYGIGRNELAGVLDSYNKAGIQRVVVTRGDMMIGATRVDGCFDSSIELVRAVKKHSSFEVIVAAYPETHPEAPSPEADLYHLKAKIDAGATAAITQFFFDNSAYYRFIERARAVGIDVPITPGLLPIANLSQTANYAKFAGVSYPNHLVHRLSGLDDDRETRRLMSASVAAEQSLDLIAHGVKNIHIYTLNKVDVVFALCHMLGLRKVSDV